MATVTPGKTFNSNEIVTPANLNALGVPTVALANNEVTTLKIADANVTTAKIADGAVTQSKLNSSVTLVPTGAVMPFAMNSAPSGWLAADGTAVSRTTYAALFAAIGTTYGAGTGGTTFNLPDLRGYFVRGAGTNTDGTASGTFGQKQGDAYPSHNHGFSDYYQSTGALVSAAPKIQDGGDTTYSVVTGGGGETGLYITGATDYQGSGTETRPDNIAMLYCIKA